MFNAASCVTWHANPVTGGTSQITQIRAGHLNASGSFANPTVPINDPDMISVAQIAPGGCYNPVDLHRVRSRFRCTGDTCGTERMYGRSCRMSTIRDIASLLVLTFSAKMAFMANAARPANLDRNGSLVFDKARVDFCRSAALRRESQDRSFLQSLPSRAWWATRTTALCSGSQCWRRDL